MLSQPRIASAVQDLERTASIDEILRHKQVHLPPPTGTVEEVARLGLYIITHVRGGHEFAGLVLGLDIRSPYGGNDAQSITREAMRRYVDPALDYLDAMLKALESGPTPEAVFTERTAVLFERRFAQAYPNTARLLQAAAAEIARADAATQWSGVANSCRQCLLEFVGELRGQVPLPSSTLKDDDLKGHVKAFLAVVRSSAESSERLERLVSAAWDYAQEVTHKRPADRHHAQIVFTWTALSILELWRVVARGRAI